MVTEEEMLRCYGKFRIENKQDQCLRRRECPWGDACLSLANEEAESIHYHRANISVGFMLFDPNHADGNSYTPDSDEEEAEKAVYAMACGDSTNDSITEDTYEKICKVLAQIADIYFTHPTTFELLMKKIYKDYNQSDLAREKGITRAGINKRLMQELGIGQKRNNLRIRDEIELEKAKKEYQQKNETLRDREKFFASLSDRDWHIYKLAFIDGCSLDSVANQLNIGTSTVARVVRFLRSKLNENGAIKRGRRPKT
jgi:RNA polymerase sigma factor (sigma-70 family)